MAVLFFRQASRESYLMTDEALVYERLDREFAGHGTVNHSDDEYVRTGGFHHTNTVESFFALFKRAVYGQFHHVSEAHMHRYLAEADFKYNHRIALGIDDAQRAVALLRGTKGKPRSTKHSSAVRSQTTCTATRRRRLARRQS